MMRMRRWLTAAIWVAAVGCAELEPGRFELEQDTGDFAAVSSMLGAHCGTLDCHGQSSRPLRLYSGRGLRLSEDDRSGHGGTRPEEHAANLRAVLGLEPEQFQQVFDAGGKHPSQLLLVRKALGSEQHTPGRVLEPAGDGFACLRSWLQRRTDQARCKAATELERP